MQEDKTNLLMWNLT